MPTTYAHNVFGKAVFQKLPTELKNIVQENSMAYQIGLHGPDVLFYYKPFKKNQISDLGIRLHEEIAAPFFKKCKLLLEKDGDPAVLAYVLGFICHFMLDSVCHPYISEYMAKTGARHDEIETEFDRQLMILTGKNPFRWRPGSFLRLDKKTLSVTCKVLENITIPEMKKALKSMRFYTGVVVRPTKTGRGLLLKGMKLLGIYEGMHGRVMRTIPSKRCEESTKQLQELFQLSVPETVTVVEDFWSTLHDLDYLNARFERNFE
jgi:hypothetical protein